MEAATSLRSGTHRRTALESQISILPRGTRRIRGRPPSARLDVCLQIPAVVPHRATEFHESRAVASKAPFLQGSYADTETLRGVALRDESSHEDHLSASGVPADWPLGCGDSGVAASSPTIWRTLVDDRPPRPRDRPKAGTPRRGLNAISCASPTLVCASVRSEVLTRCLPGDSR